MDQKKQSRDLHIPTSRAELLLEQTESLAKVGYWELDLTTQQLQWSDGVFRLAGYEPGEFEVNFESAVNVIHPEDREKAIEMMHKTIASNDDYAIQKRFVTKDGNVKHIRSVAKRIDDENGNPSRLIGIFHDITDIVNAKFGVTDERFKALVEQGADLTAILNMQGEIVYLSPSYKSVLGYDEADLLGKVAFEFIHPDDALAIIGEFQLLQTQRRIESSNYRFKHKDGSWVWTRSVGTNLVEDGGVDGFLINSVDLTSIMEIQEKLKRNNELYEYLNKASNNAIYDWDVVEDNYEWGEGFYRMLGYDPFTRPFKMADWVDLEHPADRKRISKLWADFLSDPNKSIWKNETRIRKSDGSYIYVEEVGHLIRDSNGNPIRMIGVLRDLSTTKELERLLDIASRLAAVGAWEVDMNEQRLIWSGMTKDILEVPPDHEPDIESISSFFKEGYSRDLRMECFNRAMADGTPYDITVQVITAKGNEKWIRSIGLPELENGKVVRINGSFQDVTQMKLAQEEVIRSNERFSKVAEATNDAIWDFDVTNNQLWWGKGFLTLFGHDPDAFQPSQEKLIMLIHPEDRERVESRIQEYMSDGVSVNWYEEYKFLKADDTYAFVIDRAIFMRDSNGIVTRVVGAMTDISYRKLYEESLLDLNKQLEISNSELEQFAYVASHDLQEPLRMVSSFLTLLEKKYGSMFDDKALQYIHYAKDGAIRMRQIILDLLEFSRVGKHSDTLKPVNINNVIRDVLALHRKLIEENSAEFHIGELPTLKTFQSPLLQVFQNLVGNALKYSKKGEKAIISISSRELSDHWEFSVTDNGIGIDPKQHDRIFVIFQRLHQKGEYAGTGMGLAIVKKILDNLGGEIWIESELGKGSTFTFSIPKQLE
jgi:PAS domain S-box-containing protein